MQNLAVPGPGQGLAYLREGSGPLLSFVYKSSTLMLMLVTQASLKRAGEIVKVKAQSLYTSKYIYV